MIAKPARETSTIVAPGGTSANAETLDAGDRGERAGHHRAEHRGPEPAENCCAVATGMIISALTSSRPTVRIATLTVTAASTEISTL